MMGFGSCGGKDDSGEEKKRKKPAEDLKNNIGGANWEAALDDALKEKKGLSKHCKGKSQSFSNLKEIEEQGTMTKDTEKKENPLNKKIKLDMERDIRIKELNRKGLIGSSGTLSFVSSNEDESIANQAQANEGDDVQKQLNEDENIADQTQAIEEEEDDKGKNSASST